MGKIRWLHISDLHYDREMMGDWPVRQEDFPDKDIDFIVFTGDLHTYGRDCTAEGILHVLCMEDMKYYACCRTYYT